MARQAVELGVTPRILAYHSGQFAHRRWCALALALIGSFAVH